MVKQCTDVVHEQWVQQLSDFLLVGKIQSPLERNPAAVLDINPCKIEVETSNIPDALKVHWADFHDMTDFLTL